LLKKIAFILLFVFFEVVGFCQSAQSTPCIANPAYRQFDFWIGEWEAFDLKGNKAGDSKIEKILDNCVILENWTGTKGNYSGKSYNTFNGTTGKWQQYWIDNKGGITEYFNGRFENDQMIVETNNVKQSDGIVKILKMTFQKIQTDKVRQLGESSLNGGTNWTIDFDLEYRRKK
jgi:hypothetical protein